MNAGLMSLRSKNKFCLCLYLLALAMPAIAQPKRDLPSSPCNSQLSSRLIFDLRPLALVDPKQVQVKLSETIWIRSGGFLLRVNRMDFRNAIDEYMFCASSEENIEFRSALIGLRDKNWEIKIPDTVSFKTPEIPRLIQNVLVLVAARSGICTRTPSDSTCRPLVVSYVDTPVETVREKTILRQVILADSLTGKQLLHVKVD